MISTACNEFHQQQFMQQYSFGKKLQSQNVSSEKLRKTLLYEKTDYKMFVKLTPDVKNGSFFDMNMSTHSLFYRFRKTLFLTKMIK